MQDSYEKFHVIEKGTSFLVKASDIFTERIIVLLANDCFQKEMRVRNLEIVKEKADWNRNFTVLENIYYKLCKTPRMSEGIFHASVAD